MAASFLLGAGVMQVIKCGKCGTRTNATPSIRRSVHKFGRPYRCVCGQTLDIPKEVPDPTGTGAVGGPDKDPDYGKRYK